MLHTGFLTACLIHVALHGIWNHQNVFTTCILVIFYVWQYESNSGIWSSLLWLLIDIKMIFVLSFPIFMRLQLLEGGPLLKDITWVFMNLGQWDCLIFLLLSGRNISVPERLAGKGEVRRCWSLVAVLLSWCKSSADDTSLLWPFQCTSRLVFMLDNVP